jgi:hypothetical protein
MMKVEFLGKCFFGDVDDMDGKWPTLWVHSDCPLAGNAMKTDMRGCSRLQCACIGNSVSLVKMMEICDAKEQTKSRHWCSGNGKNCPSPPSHLA